MFEKETERGAGSHAYDVVCCSTSKSLEDVSGPVDMAILAFAKAMPLTGLTQQSDGQSHRVPIE